MAHQNYHATFSFPNPLLTLRAHHFAFTWVNPWTKGIYLLYCYELNIHITDFLLINLYTEVIPFTLLMPPLSPSPYTVRHLRDVCGGDHVCYLCKSEEEKWRVLCQYFQVGLERNEKVVFFEVLPSFSSLCFHHCYFSNLHISFLRRCSLFVLNCSPCLEIVPTFLLCGAFPFPECLSFVFAIINYYIIVDLF